MAGDAWLFQPAQRQQGSFRQGETRGEDCGSLLGDASAVWFLCDTDFAVGLTLLFCVSELDLGPKRVGAGCGGQQEDALPQLRRAGLRGDGIVQGAAGRRRPGPGPPVSAAVGMGQTLEQPGHGHSHLSLPGPDQLPVQ